MMTVSILLILIVGFVLLALVIAGVGMVLINRKSGSSIDQYPAMGATRPTVGGTVEHEARNLLAQGNKIGAIKLVRESTGLGLKEAKDYVESLDS